jgi:hypothetical protein
MTNQIKAPVNSGQVLIKKFSGEKGMDVVACRTMDAMGRSVNKVEAE